jgi:hypothetical protein
VRRCARRNDGTEDRSRAGAGTQRMRETEEVKRARDGTRRRMPGPNENSRLEIIMLDKFNINNIDIEIKRQLETIF